MPEPKVCVWQWLLHVQTKGLCLTMVTPCPNQRFVFDNGYSMPEPKVCVWQWLLHARTKGLCLSMVTPCPNQRFVFVNGFSMPEPKVCVCQWLRYSMPEPKVCVCQWLLHATIVTPSTKTELCFDICCSMHVKTRDFTLTIFTPRPNAQICIWH